MKNGPYEFWWDVPVEIVGTPNPEAVHAMWESVREWEAESGHLQTSGTHVPEAADAGWMPAQPVVEVV